MSHIAMAMGVGAPVAYALVQLVAYVNQTIQSLGL